MKLNILEGKEMQITKFSESESIGRWYLSLFSIKRLQKLVERSWSTPPNPLVCVPEQRFSLELKSLENAQESTEVLNRYFFKSLFSSSSLSLCEEQYALESWQTVNHVNFCVKPKSKSSQSQSAFYCHCNHM